MGFYLSPQVVTKEKDLSVSVPAVSTTSTGVVGAYRWGPCFQRTLITQDSELLSTFYQPDDDTYEHWYSAWNFLQYASTLYVVRAVDDATAKNGGLEIDSANYIVITLDDAAPFSVGDDITGDSVNSNDGEGIVIAIDTNDVTVSVTTGTFVDTNDVDNANPFSSSEATMAGIVDADGAPVAASDYIGNDEDVENYTPTFAADNSKWQIFAKYPGERGSDIKVAIANADDFATEDIISGVAFVDEFDYAPLAGEVAIAVIDGADSDTILEKWTVSLTAGAKNLDNINYYCEDFINTSSNYILLFDKASNTDTPASQIGTVLAGGVNGYPAVGDITTGYDLFENKEEIDVSMIIDGANNDAVTGAYIVDNLTEDRKDCIAVLNVPKADVVGVSTVATAVSNMITYATTTLNKSSSWASLYGNWKYQYDSYADKYRWVPMTGDVAGITAQSHFTRDPWFAPAFYNRGLVKNSSKLAVNPKLTYRDQLYQANVNPIITSPGDGHVVLGQKTLLAAPSSFNRLDVRWLFLVIEKAIALAAKYFMGEKNTPYTRRQFKGLVDPYLRDVQGREGITEFYVDVSDTVNTPEVISRNEFRGVIYVKPTMTAEFIILDFVNVKQGVSFDEVIKKA